MSADAVLSIWDRVLRTDDEPLAPEVAAQVLRLRLPDEDRERIGVLSQKAEEGSLSEDERAELEAYTHAAAFLTILQSRARVGLRTAGTPR